MRIRRTVVAGIAVLALATACMAEAAGAGSSASPATGSAFGTSLPPTDEPVAAVAAEAFPAVVHDTTDLGNILADLQPGDGVPVEVDRRGQQQTFTVTLDVRPYPTQLP